MLAGVSLSSTTASRVTLRVTKPSAPSRGSGKFEPTREVHMRLTGPEPRLWVADDQPERSFTTPELVREHITKLLPG
jgi:hypothetical protein